MATLHSFTVTDFIDSLISLLGAFVLGALIGAERQYRQRQGNRAPMNEQTTEAIYEVRLATHPDNLNEARELLTARLQDAIYPIREIEVIERDEETIEVVLGPVQIVKSWTP